MIKFLIIFLNLFLFSNAFKICVVGGSSGLGKELIFQSINERDHDVLALTSGIKPITVPCRQNSFNEIKNQKEYNHPNLIKANYWDDISNFSYENIIFTTSAKPFEDDYSDKLMKKVLENLSEDCKSITLVSAFGVSDSLKKGNLGISIMNSWYLKDVYRAKNEQEDILKKYKKNIKKYVLRPKALSYGETQLESLTRRKLATDILDKIDSIN